ncbi:HDOD domain-containing protein, partial [Massilia arenosa]
ANDSVTAAPARVPATAGSGIAFDQADLAERLYNAWIFGMEGDAPLDVSPAEARVLEALDAILNSQQSGAALVRRMPGLIPQLLQTLRSESFSGAQLSRTISSDVVLVAAVTRLANASIKGSGKSIDSVEHAVIVIGHEGLRHLITSVAFRPIIDMNSGHYTRTLAPRVWERSERVAEANRALADQGQLNVDRFEAFLAGLVQNAGLIVALRVMDQVAGNDRTLGSEMFCAKLVRAARALTCSIGREWDFPEAVMQAIAEQGQLARGGQLSPLGRLLALSDYAAKLRTLVENTRIEDNDILLFGGLPALAKDLYAAMPAADSQAAA